VKEWAYFIFFGYLGILPEVSVTAAIVSRFAQTGLSLIGIPAYFQEKRVQKSELHTNKAINE
jgi:hypothetical protein